jgi:hypothetical protein
MILWAVLLGAVIALDACGPRVPSAPRLHPTLEGYRRRRATRAPTVSDAGDRAVERELADASEPLASNGPETTEPEPAR